MVSEPAAVADCEFPARVDLGEVGRGRVVGDVHDLADVCERASDEWAEQAGQADSGKHEERGKGDVAAW